MTNLATDFHRADAEVERADLSDVLGMVAVLGTAVRLGGEFRRTAQALADAAPDLEHMDGLVHDGEVYNATVRQMWGACRCADDLHDRSPSEQLNIDFWRPTKRDAEERVARMVERRGRWEKDGPVPHLVSHLVARTSVEVVR